MSAHQQSYRQEFVPTTTGTRHASTVPPHVNPAVQNETEKTDPSAFISFAKHHDVNSVELNSSRSTRHDLSLVYLMRCHLLWVDSSVSLQPLSVTHCSWSRGSISSVPNSVFQPARTACALTSSLLPRQIIRENLRDHAKNAFILQQSGINNNRGYSNLQNSYCQKLQPSLLVETILACKPHSFIFYLYFVLTVLL